MQSVDPATVRRRQLNLPQEVCPVSRKRLRLSQGSLTAGQKSAEGIVSGNGEGPNERSGE
jgi:hypothetical protein